MADSLERFGRGKKSPAENKIWLFGSMELNTGLKLSRQLLDSPAQWLRLQLPGVVVGTSWSVGNFRGKAHLDSLSPQRSFSLGKSCLPSYRVVHILSPLPGGWVVDPQRACSLSRLQKGPKVKLGSSLKGWIIAMFSFLHKYCFYTTLPQACEQMFSWTLLALFLFWKIWNIFERGEELKKNPHNWF